MAAFSGRQRAEFAVLAEKQIRDGRQSCEYPQANTLALQLDAYYTAVSLPNVTGVDTTFNRALPHVVFKVHTGDTVVFMCFPCANAKRRMYELTWIINRALARARRETSELGGGFEAVPRARRRYVRVLRKATQILFSEAGAGRGSARSGVDVHQVIKLDFKPVLPGQFKRAFERAGVAVCDAEGQWLYELRLLGMGPSVYALGANDGREEVWANNTDEVCSASVYLRETAGVQEIIKSAVVVYYE